MTAEHQNVSDEDLACQVQAGSLACFEELVRRHQSRIFHFLLLKLGNTQDAEDATQTTFIAAYRAMGRYRPNHRFLTWLFTIARRQAISMYRARRPTEPLTADPTDLRTPDRSLVSRDDCGQIWALARRTLPEAQLSALWLCYAEELSVREIARTMEKTATHVKVLLHRGRKTLARELDHRAVTHSPPVPASMIQERIP